MAKNHNNSSSYSSSKRRSNNSGSKKLDQMNNRKFTRSNSSKDQRREKESIDAAIDSFKSRTNDISWYTNFPQFTKDAGTLPFGTPLGQNLAGLDSVYLPGIMGLYFYPGIGYSADLTSPINRSAIRFYTYLRNIQKSAAKYDAADIMMYLLALDSCYMFYSHMRRAYAIAQLYSPVNKYYPTKLLALLGFSASIADNLAEFRAYINRFAISLGSYTVPKGIDLFNRHQWMCEGIYTDASSTRAQTYVFIPEGFWMYDNTVTTGSQLKFQAWQDQSTATTTLHDLASVQSIGNSLINAILNDQDTGDISGDIYSAYGENSVKRLLETPEGLQLIPIYDQTVLSQIENATIVGRYASSYTPVISQNPSVNNGAIIYTPVFSGANATDPSSGYVLQPLFSHPYQFINMHKDSPSPDEVIEATRLMAGVNTDGPFSATQPNLAPTTFGADVISMTKIGVMSDGGGMRTIVAYTNGLQYILTSSAGTTNTQLEYLALSNNFDWAPMMWIWQSNVNAAGADYYDVDLVRPASDVDNMTVVTFNQLSNMHEAVMLSLFDVPQMGM